jgi:hypothetical protein
LIIVAVAFTAIFAWPPWVVFYTDWLWFKDLGYQTVFSTMLVTKVTLGLTVGLLAAAFTWLNFGLASRPSHEPADVQEVSRETGRETDPEAGPRSFVINGQRIPAPDLARLAGRLALPAALAIGAYAGLLAWGAWDIWLRYRYQSPFGEADPIFGRDIAFYFFTLPALEALASLLFIVTVVSLIGTAAIYVVRGVVRGAARVAVREPMLGSDTFSKLRQFAVGRGPRSHLLSLVAVLFLALAGQAYLGIPNLLFSTSGPMAGASYTDINATLPLLYAQVSVAALVALLAAASLLRSNALSAGGDRQDPRAQASDCGR